MIGQTINGATILAAVPVRHTAGPRPDYMILAEFPVGAQAYITGRALCTREPDGKITPPPTCGAVRAFTFYADAMTDLSARAGWTHQEVTA